MPNQMKKLLLVLATLPLVSCIPVDDFGAYWDNAGTDSRLLGNWRRIAANPNQTRDHGYGIGDIMQFGESNGAYYVTSDVAKARGEQPMQAKTLTAGLYQFLALAHEHKGIIERYKVSSGALEFCDSFGPSLAKYVAANYPRAANINRNHGDYISITKLDGEALTILSRIPDSEPYWTCNDKFERVP